MQKIEPIDLFTFLRACPLYPKVYWSSRDEDLSIAAIGSMKAKKNTRKFGWRHFFSTSSSEWSDFALARFFQPRYELVCKNSSCFLIQNDPEPFQFDSLNREPKNPNKIVIHQIVNLPSKKEWIHQVEKALRSIHLKHFEKVVLARRVQIDFASPIDPFSLCQSLQTHHHTVFLFQPTPNSAFLGATPERLYRKKNQDIECDALAATKPINLKNELLKSEKEMREFMIVKNRIVETLSPYCQAKPSASPTTIRTSNQLCHLYSKIQGKLTQDITDQTLLDILHPTPALSGFPRQAAENFLIQTEPFARGLYGAPIGWTTDSESDFAVGIRSCLIHGSSVSIYAGAGIVEGSDPNLEWEESEQKLDQFRSCLTI